MTVRDQHLILESTFTVHGVFEARYLGKAARDSFLSEERFDALLKALVAEWLEAGYSPAAVVAAEQAAHAAYRHASHPEQREWVKQFG
jgi:hypothetical protein